jgi:hypothetical protein
MSATFRSSVSIPSSGPTNKPRRKQMKAGGTQGKSVCISFGSRKEKETANHFPLARPYHRMSPQSPLAPTQQPCEPIGEENRLTGLSRRLTVNGLHGFVSGKTKLFQGEEHLMLSQ